MSDVAVRLRRALREAADPERAASMQRFFKGGVDCLGVPSGKCKAILKPFIAEVRGLPKPDVWRICEELRRSGVMEESGAAADLAMAQKRNFAPEDVDVFQHWIDEYVRDWASCDALCCHAVSALIEKHPGTADRMLAWALSDRPYTRRAAAVSFTAAAKRGGHLEHVLRIADILLEDEEDIVR